MEKEKKGLNKALIILIVLAIIFLIAGLIYKGYKSITESANQKDLNVTYSEQDYTDLINNIGLEVKPEELCFDCELPSFDTPQDISMIITSEQASAFIDTANKSLNIAGISNTQIKFSDNSAEVSTIITYNGNSYPVYLKGNISRETAKTVNVTLDTVKTGVLSLPSTINSTVENGIEDLFNNYISNIGDTFRIDELNITESGLQFKGQLPSSRK